MREVISVVVIVVAITIMLAGYLAVATIMWRRIPQRRMLFVLVALAFGMFWVWILTDGLVLLINFGEASSPSGNDGTQIYELINWTFGIVIPCERFPALHNMIGTDQTGDVICGFVVAPITGTIMFYLIGLVPALFVRRREQQTQENTIVG